MKKNLIKYRIPVFFSLALVLFMGGLLLAENMMRNINEENNTPTATTPIVKEEQNVLPSGAENTAEEVLALPVSDDVAVVRHYYRNDDESERQQSSVDYFEGVYRPSVGIDFKQDDLSFEVLAAVSGTIKEVRTDPLFGKCISLEGSNGMNLVYQSLADVKVSEGDVVKQGQPIATSGNNVYESELGNHMHFVLEIEGKTYDPESNFQKKINEIQ